MLKKKRESLIFCSFSAFQTRKLFYCVLLEVRSLFSVGFMKALVTVKTTAIDIIAKMSAVLKIMMIL